MMNRLGWPNGVTLVRLLLTLPFLLLLVDYGFGPADWKRRAALGVFGLMALTDMLDGFLARRLQQFTPLGRFLDPLADKLLIVSSLILLSYVPIRQDVAASEPSWRVPPWLLLVSLAKDFVVTAGFLQILSKTRQVHIQPRLTGKCCTFAQMTLVVIILAVPEFPAIVAPATTGLIYVSGGLALAATIDYGVQGQRFLANHEHAKLGPGLSPESAKVMKGGL